MRLWRSFDFGPGDCGSRGANSRLALAGDGRARPALPLADEVGPPKKDRFVGIFYFLWLNERHNKSPQGDHPFDISKIMAADPDGAEEAGLAAVGADGAGALLGEPLYGYYLSDDAWVIRRHAQLLADAGVDTLIFDTTNAATYKRVYLKLCEVFTQIRKEGGRTPQIAFMVNTKAGETAAEIYRDLYEPGLYRELWFQWQGKPLLICDPEEAGRSCGRSSRCGGRTGRSRWRTRSRRGTGRRRTRSRTGTRTTRSAPEQVNVSVAQNLGAYGPSTACRT